MPASHFLPAALAEAGIPSESEPAFTADDLLRSWQFLDRPEQKETRQENAAEAVSPAVADQTGTFTVLLSATALLTDPLASEGIANGLERLETAARDVPAGTLASGDGTASSRGLAEAIPSSGAIDTPAVSASSGSAAPDGPLAGATASDNADEVFRSFLSDLGAEPPRAETLPLLSAAPSIASAPLPTAPQQAQPQTLIDLAPGLLPEQALMSEQLPQAVQPDLGRAPLGFEANLGQAASDVSFLARGKGYSIFLTEQGPVLALARSGAGAEALTEPAARDLVRLRFEGARADATLEAVGELAGKSHYFRGGAQPLKLTDVPQYAEVVAHDLYQGVDVVYQGDQGRLRFDLHVRPGADLSQIELRYEGADGLSVDDQGRLVLRTSGGDVIQRAPLLYQDRADQRQTVTGRYVLRGSDRIGFAAEGYDPDATLVIDPTLEFSTYFGGSGQEAAADVAVDVQGNAYLVGWTWSTDLPVAGAVQDELHGMDDVLVSKFDRQGQLVFSTYLGGSQGFNPEDQASVLPSMPAATLT